MIFVFQCWTCKVLLADFGDFVFTRYVWAWGIILRVFMYKPAISFHVFFMYKPAVSSHVFYLWTWCIIPRVLCINLQYHPTCFVYEPEVASSCSMYKPEVLVSYHVFHDPQMSSIILCVSWPANVKYHPVCFMTRKCQVSYHVFQEILCALCMNPMHQPTRS